MRGRGPLFGLGFFLSSVLLACGGKQEPGEAGEDCYRDSDCKPGLVCVPAGENERKCSSDLTGLESTVEAPPMQVPPEPAAGGMPATGGTPAAGGTDATSGTGATGGA